MVWQYLDCWLPSRSLPACSQWKERKCQRSLLCRKTRLFPGSLLIINSCRNSCLSSSQKTLGINLFFSVCMAQRYPPNSRHRDYGGLGCDSLLSIIKSQEKVYKHNSFSFPLSRHNPNSHGRLQRATWCRSQVIINDKGNSPELVQDVCCWETMSRGK